MVVARSSGRVDGSLPSGDGGVYLLSGLLRSLFSLGPVGGENTLAATLASPLLRGRGAERSEAESGYVPAILGGEETPSARREKKILKVLLDSPGRLWNP